MTDLVAKVVDCQRLADRLIENKGSLEGDTVLRHDPDGGCTDCPLRTVLGPYYDSSDVCEVVGRECVYGIGKPAPDWCPLRKGRVVVEREET